MPETPDKATPTGSTDPRIRRTKAHVLSVARDLLESGEGALTFSLLAERAQVSRQTLYTHWGTVENVIAETIVVGRTRSLDAYSGLDVRARADLFIRELIETLDPAMSAATAAILAAMHHSEAASDAFDRISYSLYDAFTESVGEATHDQFVEIVSPVLMKLLPRGSVSEELIASLAERTEQLVAPRAD